MSIPEDEIERVLESLIPLMREELVTGKANLGAVVHHTGGRIYPGDPNDQEGLRAWLASLAQEPQGEVSRKKITGAFVTNIVANMCGSASDISQYKFHDCGTGTNAEANTDVALQTEISTPTTRATGTQVAGGTATAPTYTSVATTGPHPAGSVTEHIIATTAARTTTAIMDRSVFTAIPINLNDYITWTYVATFNAEA